MATQRPWTYLQNPILSVTENSFKLAVRISEIHLSALIAKAGDAFFDALITTYQPLHTALVNAYDAWRAQGGSQQGQTLNVLQMLRLLSNTKIKAWDIAIQTVYNDTTMQYKALLPNHRTPFQAGSQTDRISAVAALVTTIGSDAALATVKTDANSFHTQLLQALETQKASISTTKTASDALEAARVAMSIGQYANLGALIQKYAATPIDAAAFFDLLALRSGSQVLFTGETKPAEHENIFKHTFSAGSDKLKLENEGDTDLQFYLAVQKNDAPGATIINVAAHTVKTVTITELGGIANTFLNLFNNNTINKGDWTVEFV